MSDPKQTFLARRDYEALVGTELGKSHWIKITQSRIDHSRTAPVTTNPSMSIQKRHAAAHLEARSPTGF